jgi:hypothetical protein
MLINTQSLINHLPSFDVHLFPFGLSNILPLPFLLKTVINANSITPVNKVTNHVNSPKNLNKENYRTVFTTQTAVPIMLNRVYLQTHFLIDSPSLLNRSFHL